MNADQLEFGRAFDLDWETCGRVFIGSGSCDLASAADHIAILRKDGTAYALGNDVYGQCQIQDRMEWKDTVQISDGHLHTLGLKPDGTVLAHGLGRYGATMVQYWRDIVAVKADEETSYGLLRDGRVISTPRDEILPGAPDGIDFSSSGETWEDLMQPDGTYCEKNSRHGWLAADWNQKWSALTALAVGRNCTAGLRKDGTVACIPTCDESYERMMKSFHEIEKQVRGWKNIRRIVGWCLLEAVMIAGLREGGRVEAAVCDGSHSEFKYLTDLRDHAQNLTGIRQIHAGAGRLIVRDDEEKLCYYPR